MEIYRSGCVVMPQCELFTQGGWMRRGERAIENGMVLAQFSDEEHDNILNLADGIGQFGLRGFCVHLVVDEPDSDDPATLDLAYAPRNGEILGHNGRYYLAKCVIQTTEPRITVFARKLPLGDVTALTFSCLSAAQHG